MKRIDEVDFPTSVCERLDALVLVGEIEPRVVGEISHPQREPLGTSDADRNAAALEQCTNRPRVGDTLVRQVALLKARRVLVSHRLANAMVRRGVTPHDRVATLAQLHEQ